MTRVSGHSSGCRRRSYVSPRTTPFFLTTTASLWPLRHYSFVTAARYRGERAGRTGMTRNSCSTETYPSTETESGCHFRLLESHYTNSSTFVAPTCPTPRLIRLRRMTPPSRGYPKRQSCKSFISPSSTAGHRGRLPSCSYARSRRACLSSFHTTPPPRGQRRSSG